MNFLWKYAVIILRKQICFLRIITAVVNTGPLLDLLLPVNDVFSVIYAKSFATEHKIKTIAMRKMGWFFIQDLNQQSKRTRCGGGVHKQCLSFILHFVAHHVSVFILIGLIEISLSIQYSSVYSSNIYNDRWIFLGFFTALFTPFLCTLLL